MIVTFLEQPAGALFFHIDRGKVAFFLKWESPCLCINRCIRRFIATKPVEVLQNDFKQKRLDNSHY
jgi:hypothetical protein